LANEFKYLFGPNVSSVMLIGSIFTFCHKTFECIHVDPNIYKVRKFLTSTELKAIKEVAEKQVHLLYTLHSGCIDSHATPMKAAILIDLSCSPAKHYQAAKSKTTLSSPSLLAVGAQE